METRCSAALLIRPSAAMKIRTENVKIAVREPTKHLPVESIEGDGALKYFRDPANSPTVLKTVRIGGFASLLGFLVVGEKTLELPFLSDEAAAGLEKVNEKVNRT